MASQTAVKRTRSSQAQTDHANAEFWNELCGSQLARTLGIEDDSPASLKKFDDWYFDYYPYLENHIPFDALKGKRVLEVGPGYGTVAQRLVEAGTHYHGLDIAAGPVAMARERLRRLGVEGDVRQGSILSCPFPSDHFDHVIAIGSLHHTGNLARAIGEVYRVLRSGSEATLMVYNAASYRHWLARPLATLYRIASPGTAAPSATDRSMRKAYDLNRNDETAPHTDYVTRHELRTLCRDFDTCHITLENIGADGPFRRLSRPLALQMFGRYLGLDLYCRAGK